MSAHDCLRGDTAPGEPTEVGQEWTCPACGTEWTGTRWKYLLRDTDRRFPEGTDPMALGWRAR